MDARGCSCQQVQSPPASGEVPSIVAKNGSIENSLEHRPQPACRQQRMAVDRLGGLPVRLAVRPGFVGWQYTSAPELRGTSAPEVGGTSAPELRGTRAPEVRGTGQAAKLIAHHAQIERGQQVLVCPCGDGGLGVWAASQTDAQHVTLLDTNFIAVQTASRSMAANGCSEARVEVALPGALGEGYDVALMQLPKGRELARLLFLHIFNAVREGGRLYLAGPNKGGIKSAINDCAKLFGPATVLGYKGGNRVASFSRGAASQGSLPEIYRVPGMANGTYRQFQIEARGRTYALCTRPGVFARRGLDAGTRLLLGLLAVRATDTVLDLGCGCGIIGIFAASLAVEGQVTLVDVDLLACECARASLALNLVENARVVLGDGLAAVPGGRFTLVVSNPPFHIGHAMSSTVAEAFIRQAFGALEPRGRLVMVANRFLPYDRLMAQVFGSVATLARTGRYHVLRSEKGHRRRSRRQEGRYARGDSPGACNASSSEAAGADDVSRGTASSRSQRSVSGESAGAS
ncbi:MAG TPA: methyltransferase [Anaerolineae bacterium]|nr:methyltransferase [Anaerolineae bacterium]